LSSLSHEEVFSKIYTDGYWGINETPKSGSGSIPAAAAPYVDLVARFIRERKISTVLDIGHGDWCMWEGYKFEDVSYIGIDVFSDATEFLRNQYGNKSRQFLTINAVTEELPEMQICLIKDVLQHLPNDDIIGILSKLEKFDYLIICNDFYKFRWKDSIKALRRFLSIGERARVLRNGKLDLKLKLKRANSTTSIGGHRPLNLEKRPFKNHLTSFMLIQKIDFSGNTKKRANLIKRVYLFKNIGITAGEN
jgi:hypothetical protein